MTMKPEHAAQPSALKEAVNNYASQCVKCALCLPHCPTYELTQDENESPRGRIALFQALAQDKLPLSPKVEQHLSRCLSCLACERVCPAHVEYDQLLTLGRALTRTATTVHSPTRTAISSRLLSWMLTKRKGARLLQWFLWSLQVTGLRYLARKLHLTTLLRLSQLEQLLPPLDKPIEFKSYYGAFNQRQGSVMLFKGCVSSFCDQQTLAASIYVLRTLGFDVHIPPLQGCCGAMAIHNGEIAKAYTLAQQNAQAFNQGSNPIDYIVTMATGCSAVLERYDYRFSSNSSSTEDILKSFSSRVVDIVTFVQHCEWPTQLKLLSLSERVILHTPCSRRNVLKTVVYPEQLLGRIPGLKWQSFSSPHCCGAAGTYMIDHPNIAQALGQNLLAELHDNQISILATTNIGCALHLQQQLKSHQKDIKVVHPIALLAQALGF